MGDTKIHLQLLYVESLPENTSVNVTEAPRWWQNAHTSHTPLLEKNFQPWWKNARTRKS